MSNRVRGPTSALSSFLRERGITAPRQVARAEEVPTPIQETTSAADATEAVDTSHDAGVTADAHRMTEDQVASLPSTVGSTLFPSSTAADDQESQALASGSNPEATGSSSTQVQNTTESDRKRTASLLKKMKRKGDEDNSDDGDYAGGDSRGSMYGSRSGHSKKQRKKGISNNGDNQPPPSDVLFCSRCQRRYLLSAATSDTSQNLCKACLGLQNKPARSISKIQLKRKKLEVLSMTGESQGVILSLRDMCIKLVAGLIDNIEQLGEISYSSKRKLSVIISKQRQLTTQTVQLFLGADEDSVELFDCTRLDEDGLLSIAYLCPNVRTLNLSLCGRITNKVLIEIGASCKHIFSLTLKGAFLPTDAGFSSMFSGLGSSLTNLSLEHAAKLTNTSLHVLSESAPNLRILNLTSCSKVGDDAIETISKMKCLEHLELNGLRDDVESSAILQLISAIGHQLTTLSLNGYNLLGDTVVEAITETCKGLSSLSLSECPLITSAGVISALKLFSTTSPEGLVSLYFNRNVLLSDDVIFVIVNRMGETLERLGLNGLDELSEDALCSIASGCIHLVDLDVSWIRCMNDDIFLKFIENAADLQRIKVYGCHDLTSATLNRVWLNRHGQAIEIQGNEFD
ncbi:hypothetical protein BASA50_007459 [Batrachochytrium salamandrivorans]|uniref:F-box/LRR-repeat protein 15-like leucin rich repeat domain-containing protein n=1 Tax=Batrachochytrium salamandrivorans TaxID=1357716 RepID=A0ABQ8F6V3_9FUNG|nr:hypothetical protein BASA60_000938 [Batrachochytrium salamandrivorans]KAH6593253.1 hypothetical protein BASA50_007459 [Batrachochytrium salamandrivorans]KAJ1343067.1 hypothetical protein BSLG_002093 [Batrachochytrium salamandrivorans]